MNQLVGSAPINRQRLDELAVFEYRTVVIGRLGVMAEWRALDWTDESACAGQVASTPTLCARCPVVAEWLAASMTTNDHSEWRGGLSRSDREHLWAALERTYRDVRDLEPMRMDVGQLSRRGIVRRLGGRGPKESRS